MPRTRRTRKRGLGGLLRRLVVGVGAGVAAGAGAGVLAVCGASAVAPPAAAAAPAGPDGGVRLSVEAPEEGGLYAASEGAEGQQDDFEFFVRPRHGVARNVEVTVDARALRAAGSLRPGHRCTGEDGVFHCRFDPRSLEYGAHVKPFRLRGRDGVRPGDGGTVRITARADNAPSAQARTRLVVRPPDLIGNRPERVPGRVEPGQRAQLRPSFANPGRWTVRSYGLKFSTYGDHLTLDRRFSNCWYASEDATRQDDTTAWCEFDTPLPPHSAWRVARPLTGRLDPEIPAESVRYEPVHEKRDKKVFSRRGEGPELTLERIPAEKVREDSRLSALVVHGTAQVDYAPVVRGTVRGRVGQTVSVRIGVRNVNGGRLPGVNPDHVEIVPPRGTTVVGTPYEVDGDPMDGACRAVRNRPGVRTCPLNSDAFESVDGRKGAASTVTVRFRIDRNVPGARGAVRAVGKYDRTPGNDTAALPADITGTTALGTSDGPDGPDAPALVLTAFGGAATVAGWAVLLRRRLRRSAGDG